MYLVASVRLSVRPSVRPSVCPSVCLIFMPTPRSQSLSNGPWWRFSTVCGSTRLRYTTPYVLDNVTRIACNW